MSGNRSKIDKNLVLTLVMSGCCGLLVAGLMWFWFLPNIADRLWGVKTETYDLNEIGIKIANETIRGSGYWYDVKLNIGSTPREQNDNVLVFTVKDIHMELPLLLICSEDDNKLKAICYVGEGEKWRVKCMSRMKDYGYFELNVEDCDSRLEPMIMQEAVQEAQEKGYLTGPGRCVAIYVDPEYDKIKMSAGQKMTILQPMHRRGKD